MIADASDSKVPVALISTCSHAYVLNNRCINCQKVFYIWFIHNQYISDDMLSNYRQVITYDGFVEYLKQDFYGM